MISPCGREDFFGDDDFKRGDFLHFQTAFRRAVVGDGDAVDAQFLAATDNFIQRRLAVHGILGVDMQIGF